MTDLLLKTDGKLIHWINSFVDEVKSDKMCLLKRLLQTGLNNLYWTVSKIIAVTLYSADSQ